MVATKCSLSVKALTNTRLFHLISTTEHFISQSMACYYLIMSHHNEARGHKEFTLLTHIIDKKDDAGLVQLL